jgi:hypothetical protein
VLLPTLTLLLLLFLQVQDEVLANIAEKVKNFAVIYLVDIDEVPDFNGMYEIFDACTTMFFYRNKLSRIVVSSSVLWNCGNGRPHLVD